jgi:hypothetical protein
VAAGDVLGDGGEGFEVPPVELEAVIPNDHPERLALVGGNDGGTDGRKSWIVRGRRLWDLWPRTRSSGGSNANAIAPALADVEKTNRTYKMIWLGCGDDDTTAIVGTRNLHNLLTSRGVKHTYVETPGAHHDYQVWRVYLATNLPMLFRD